MKKINIRFEADPSLEDIDVLLRAAERDAEVNACIERISAKPPAELIVTDQDGALVRLAPENIILVSVSGNVTLFETEQGRYSVRQTLQKIEQELAGGSFLRISRSELVNTNKIEKYDFSIRGELRLELTGGIETWAARRCIPEVRRRIKGKE